MAKIQLKSDNLTPFGGIFHIFDQFDKHLGSLIDKKLGIRSRLFGYQYSEIFRAIFGIFFCIYPIYQNIPINRVILQEHRFEAGT